MYPANFRQCLKFPKSSPKESNKTQKTPALNSQSRTFISKKGDKTRFYSGAVTGLSKLQTPLPQNSETKNSVSGRDAALTTKFIFMIIKFSEKFSETLVHKVYLNTLPELRKASTAINRIFSLFTGITKKLKYLG